MRVRVRVRVRLKVMVRVEGEGKGEVYWLGLGVRVRVRIDCIVDRPYERDRVPCFCALLTPSSPSFSLFPRLIPLPLASLHSEASMNSGLSSSLCFCQNGCQCCFAYVSQEKGFTNMSSMSKQSSEV